MMKELKIHLTGLLTSGSLESSKRDIISLQRTKNKIERDTFVKWGTDKCEGSSEDKKCF